MARPGMVHWSVEGSGPFKDEPVTEDKTQVTCPDCLRMLAWMRGELDTDRWRGEDG